MNHERGARAIAMSVGRYLGRADRNVNMQQHSRMKKWCRSMRYVEGRDVPTLIPWSICMGRPGYVKALGGEARLVLLTRLTKPLGNPSCS